MGEKWEYLKLTVEYRIVSRDEGGDDDTLMLAKKFLMGKYFLDELGKLGWKMCGVTSIDKDPELNGTYFFVRELR